MCVSSFIFFCLFALLWLDTHSTAALWFSAGFRAALQAEWWWVLFSTWVQNLVLELNAQVWCPRGVWQLKQTLPEFCASPVMLNRKIKLKGMTLFATRSQELSVYTVSLVPFSFTSIVADRLAWNSWGDTGAKWENVPRRQNCVVGVNSFAVRSYCVRAFKWKSWRKGSKSCPSLHEMLHPQDWLRWRNKVSGTWSHAVSAGAYLQ